MLKIPSPNLTKGRTQTISAIVIHCMDGSLTGTDSWFQNPASKVSAHYGIGKKGEVHQYVDENDTAWHAGRIQNPTWKSIRGNINPNTYTIGIEHEAKSDSIWSEEMIQASVNLIKDICKRWNIPIDREHIVGHREIFSGKSCPGNNKIVDELVAMAQTNDGVLLKDATLQEIVDELKKRF